MTIAPLAATLGSAAYANDGTALAQARAGQDAQLLQTAFSPELSLDLAASDPEEGALAPKGALYTLEQFMFSGVVNWGGYKFTYYSQQVLPGGGLAIPGRHVNDEGYVSDVDGYIVLAGSAALGTVYETPFGYQGKIYDRGTAGTHLDVYIR